MKDKGMKEEELKEYICDKLCKYSNSNLFSQEQLEVFCNDCKLECLVYGMKLELRK